MSYLNCSNYFFKKNNYTVEYEAFYYDEKNNLRTKLTYSQYEYPGKIDEKNEINPTALELVDLVYYTYKTLGNAKKLIIGKHAIGKPEWRETDSTVLDKFGRIIRFNSYAKRGTMGERVYNNLNNITEYKYGDKSVTITTYAIYCLAPLSDFDCFILTQDEKDITLIVYNNDRTKREKYAFYKSGKKFLVSRYKYLKYQ